MYKHCNANKRSLFTVSYIKAHNENHKHLLKFWYLTFIMVSQVLVNFHCNVIHSRKQIMETLLTAQISDSIVHVAEKCIVSVIHEDCKVGSI